MKADHYYMNKPTNLDHLYPSIPNPAEEAEREIDDFIQQGKMVLMLLAFAVAAYGVCVWLVG